MPKMKNISQRTFNIGGKELKAGETGDFAQSVIDKHLEEYQGELEAVDGDSDGSVPRKGDNLGYEVDKKTTSHPKGKNK